MENSTNNKKKKRGFTLVELVIVLAVMGIIALIAIPSLSGTKENFKIKADKKSILTVKKAVEIVFLDDDDAVSDGKYYVSFTGTPSKINNVVKEKSDGTVGTDEESTLKKVLQDTNGPQTAGAKYYKISVSTGADKNKTIVVSVIGEDGKDLNGITTATP